MMVPSFGFHEARACSVRNARATEVLNGFACMASRNPETIADGLPSLAGPGGLKYGGSCGRSGAWDAARCTAPDSGRVAQPASATASTARIAARARRALT